jgi:hypothetical protein
MHSFINLLHCYICSAPLNENETLIESTLRNQITVRCICTTLVGAKDITSTYFI